ncbi:MAG: CDP-alcohol phosphatidyltransferase family protein, partial [Alphaproteobacteria bacterium]|nr:CDP-alcohol phosphatidyltransferase family protein [Alphaproteobacteria bacterium]
MLFHLLTHNLKMSPLYISKINTVAQIVLAGAVLGSFALDVDAEMAVFALVWLVGATTVLSGANYVIAWTAKAASIEDSPR